MKVRCVEAGSVQLAVSEGGPPDAPPVLVLHGFTGSARAMEQLTTPLAARCRVVAPDLVGHGRSDAPESVAPYTAGAMVAQLGAVAGLMAGTPIDVIGYSMGARAALTFAVAEPALVRRLVLIGGTAGLDDAHTRAARVAHDEALAADIEEDGIEDFVDRWEALPLWATEQNLPAATRAAIRSGRLSQRPLGLANSLRGFGTGIMPSLWSSLAKLIAPTLLIVGELDAKYRETASQLESRLPNARCHVVPEAGHAAHIHAPADVASASLRHLGW